MCEGTKNLLLLVQSSDPTGGMFIFCSPVTIPTSLSTLLPLGHLRRVIRGLGEGISESDDPARGLGVEMPPEDGCT